MTDLQSRRLSAGLVGSLLLIATSCGAARASSESTTPATAASEQAAPSTTDAAPLHTETSAAPEPSPQGTTLPPAQSAGGRVNINDAGTSELEAAFKAAGVTNPRRWAREVDEYRPYPSDPDFAKLRQELGKYNIDPAVLELIISTLEF